MSYEQSRIIVFLGSVTVVRALLASLLAGTVFGTVMAVQGQLSAVAGLYGLAGIVSAWVFIYVHSFGASALFVVAITRLARTRYAPLPLRDAIDHPFPGACVGLVYGLLLWLLGVGYAVPYALNALDGAGRPVPYAHGESFFALLAFGAVLGATYPVLRVRVTERE